MRGWKSAVALGLAALLGAGALAGCATAPRLDAVGIVEWQHQERERLQAQGFEQYSGE
ncbi:MAG: hypothetical protein KJ025_02595 [Burkholderiales bacterium]|nr:hypothetical protein [Burkholderiales bacterium]